MGWSALHWWFLFGVTVGEFISIGMGILIINWHFKRGYWKADIPDRKAYLKDMPWPFKSKEQDR